MSDVMISAEDEVKRLRRAICIYVVERTDFETPEDEPDNAAVEWFVKNNDVL